GDAEAMRRDIAARIAADAGKRQPVEIELALDAVLALVDAAIAVELRIAGIKAEQADIRIAPEGVTAPAADEFAVIGPAEHVELDAELVSERRRDRAAAIAEAFAVDVAKGALDLCVQAGDCGLCTRVVGQDILRYMNARKEG